MEWIKPTPPTKCTLRFKSHAQTTVKKNFLWSSQKIISIRCSSVGYFRIHSLWLNFLHCDHHPSFQCLCIVQTQMVTDHPSISQRSPIRKPEIMCVLRQDRNVLYQFLLRVQITKICIDKPTTTYKEQPSRSYLLWAQHTTFQIARCPSQFSTSTSEPFLSACEFLANTN